MTVSELIEKLREMPQDADVGFAAPRWMAETYEINAVYREHGSDKFVLLAQYD